MKKLTITREQLEAALKTVWPFAQALSGIDTPLQIEALDELIEKLNK